MKPYVISSDLGLAWRHATKRILPPTALQKFRTEGKEALEKIFGNCDWIPEVELEQGLRELLTKEDLPIVGLDPVYVPEHLRLNITRAVTARGEEAGYSTREGVSLDLVQTVHTIANTIESPDIVLMDDVLFSGALFTRLVELFARVQKRVVRVYAGVSIAEGRTRLHDLGCEVRSVRAYNEVIDEICERDFMPGAPLSGRTVVGHSNTGMPYLLPFGNALSWASFPSEHASPLSALFLKNAAAIYKETGLRAPDLPRAIFGVSPKNSKPVDEILRETADTL